MQPIYYDILIVAVLLLAAWHGYRRGLFLTICGFLAIFVGLIGAGFLSNMLAEPVSQWVEPKIEQALSTVFQEARQDVETAISDKLDEHGNELSAITDQPGEYEEELTSLSLTLEEVLERLKSNELYASFSDTIEDAVESGILEITNDAVHSITHFITLQITQAVLFLIFFLLIQILWSIFSHALNLAFHLPILSTMNRWSGLALGAVQGLLIVFIVCGLMQNRLVTPDVLEQTHLLKFFCTFDPLLYFSGASFTTSS